VIDRYAPLNFLYGTYDVRHAEWLHHLEESLRRDRQFRRLTFQQTQQQKLVHINAAIAEIDARSK